MTREQALKHAYNFISKSLNSEKNITNLQLFNDYIEKAGAQFWLLNYCRYTGEEDAEYYKRVGVKNKMAENMIIEKKQLELFADALFLYKEKNK
jgi:uncharacterized membrane protein